MKNTVENTVVEAVVVVETVKRGRPVNPYSTRQARLAKPKTGRTGRPINPESKRQEKIAKREKGELHRGRPVNPESVSYKRKLEREEFIKNGGVIKRGRPAFKKDGITFETRVNPNWKQDKNGKWRDDKGHFVKKELLEAAFN